MRNRPYGGPDFNSLFPDAWLNQSGASAVGLPCQVGHTRLTVGLNPSVARHRLLAATDVLTLRSQKDDVLVENN